jgi:hypothetical protein
MMMMMMSAFHDGGSLTRSLAGLAQSPADLVRLLCVKRRSGSVSHYEAHRIRTDRPVNHGSTRQLAFYQDPAHMSVSRRGSREAAADRCVNTRRQPNHNDFTGVIMAKIHYSADSAPLPLPRLLYLVRSELIGTSRAPVGECGTATAGEAFPTTPPSIG